jgi:hypothetical protein
VSPFGRGRRRDVEQRRAALDPLLEALGAAVGDLAGEDPPREGPGAADYQEALDLYASARDALPAADEREEVVLVRGDLIRGLIAARRARALADGGPPPVEGLAAAAGLCVFDPGHGWAVEEREVTTDLGLPTRAPLCAACADRAGSGRWPVVRMVPLNRSVVPYWEGLGVESGFGPEVYPRWLRRS